MIYQDYIKRILDKNKDLKLYKIFADYRPKDIIKEHWYYVLGKNQKDAKVRFKRKITWLKIYEITECDEDISTEVISNPDKYIVF